MIFQFVNSSKFKLFYKVLSQTISRNFHTSEVLLSSDTKPCTDNYHSYFTTNFGKRVRRSVVRVDEEQIEAVTAVLKVNF